MSAKGFVVALSFLVSLFSTFSTTALAQNADAAFVVGGSFVSDSTATFGVPCFVLPCPGPPTFISTVHVDHQVFLEGALGFQTLNAKLAALYIEVPIAGIPSQTLHLSTPPSTVFGHMSSFYVTPGFRLKLAPSAPISPFVALGVGLAHYSIGSGATNKGALEYGGGLDFKTGIPHLGFRAEVRDFLSGDPNFNLVGGLLSVSSNESGLHRHNILAGGGVVLRF